MNQKNTRRGFTLIELLVVVLITGILAAVAVPQYQKAVEKSKVAQALTFLNAIYKGHQLCVLQNGDDTEKCGIDDEENLATNNLLVNIDIELPGELETGDDCYDGTVCVKTKDWEFGTDTSDYWYAERMKNEDMAYMLSISLRDDGYFKPGMIICNDGEESFCTTLCGSNGCQLN